MKAQEMEYTPLLIYQFVIHLDTYIVVPVSNVNILLGCQLFSITIMNRSIRNRHTQGWTSDLLVCMGHGSIKRSSSRQPANCEAEE